MAKRLSRLIRWAALTVGACSLAHSAGAQSALVDPTKPPSMAAGTARGGAPEQAASQRLQSILISPTRKLAVIDGRTVTEGSRIEAATVVQIAETRVTLRQGAELMTLELYPGIQRTPGKGGPR
jgi:MSHA biogenesis protein MshK